MAAHTSILAWRIPMDGGAWWATVHEVTKSRTRLSNFTFFLTSVLVWIVSTFLAVGFFLLLFSSSL